MSSILDRYKGKDIVCIGSQREGQSLKLFLAKNAKIKSFRFISQKDGPDYLDKLAVDFNNNMAVFKSAGVPGRLMPVPYSTLTTLFLELVAQTRAIVVGVTGTKGKSTTSSLIAHILLAAGKRVVFCGNIGVPALDVIDNVTDDSIVVIELGVYHTVDLTTTPHISVYTNLSQDHIPYFGSLASYTAAKHKLIEKAGTQDYVVYNPDYELLDKWATSSKAIAKPIDLGIPVDLSRSQLFGKHNELNAIMAIEVVGLLGVVDKHIIQQAIDSFVPVPHRLQNVATVLGVVYIDDAIGTTPEATIAGISAVTENIGQIGCLLLGGEDRGYDYAELVSVLVRCSIGALVLFPDTGSIIEKLLPKGYRPKTLHTTSMHIATHWASQQCNAGQVVMLSCAAPSYSLWRDFEHKGQMFQEAVAELGSIVT